MAARPGQVEMEEIVPLGAVPHRVLVVLYLLGVTNGHRQRMYRCRGVLASDGLKEDLEVHREDYHPMDIVVAVVWKYQSTTPLRTLCAENANHEPVSVTYRRCHDVLA